MGDSPPIYRPTITLEFDDSKLQQLNYNNITVMRSFANLSPEEMRLQKYQDMSEVYTVKMKEFSPKRKLYHPCIVKDEGRMHCITCMEAHEDMSLEELRLMDYNGIKKPKGLFSCDSGIVYPTRDFQNFGILENAEFDSEDKMFLKPFSETKPLSEPETCRITLRNPKMYTTPCLSILDALTKNEHCYVNSFTVEHEVYGSVTFPGKINVYGQNLDEIFVFVNQAVKIYPDDTKTPPYGNGFHRLAEIRLRNMWPKKETINHDEIFLFGLQLKNACNLNGWKFISYDFSTGIWKFRYRLEYLNKLRVVTFSKQSLGDSINDF